MIPLLPYLLHHANRSTKDPEFYAIKDSVLKKYGTTEGYDIQHIPGKKCRKCGGFGYWTKYSMYPPYKAYDWPPCWSCAGTGYFKMPQWNCLARIKFGPFTFHSPLKREERIKNPWTKENMGFEITDKPIIKGYIEHTESPVGVSALLILYYMYNREAFRKLFKEHLHIIRWRIVWKYRKILSWKTYILHKPIYYVPHWIDDSGNATPLSDDELPF